MTAFSPQSHHSLRGQRGSLLVIAIVFVSIAAVSLALTTRTLIDFGRMLDRKGDSVKALQGAESGLALVLDLFNRPERWDPDVTWGTNPFVSNPDDPTDYATMTDLLSGVAELVVREELYPRIIASGEVGGEAEQARITRIVLRSVDGSMPQSFRDICVVESTAVSTKYGIERTVQAVLRAPVNYRLEAPAAILAYDPATTFGNAQVHWGDIWSMSNVDLSKQPSNYNDSPGPTTVIRSNGNLIAGNSGLWNIPQSVQTSTTITDVAAASGSSTIQNQFRGRLLQNQNLTFPHYDYNEIKLLAQQFGSYYSTDAAGNIYRNGIETPENIVSFASIMNIDPNEIIDGDHGEWSNFVFIDTIDGNPPAADKSNLPSLSIQGTGEGTRFMRGFWFVNAHLDIRGVGSSAVTMTVPTPPRPADWNSTVSWPTSPTTQISVISDGILLVAGNIVSTGQPAFRGSLITFGTFSGGGTPRVYYDPDLRRGKNIKTLSSVEVSSWRILRNNAF